MTKVTVTANELTDVEVGAISLVKRGANQIPFRLIKSDRSGDSDMINLSSVFKRAPAPVVMTAVAVSKNLSLEDARARVEAAGLKASDVVETDDAAFLFPQVEGDFSESDITVIKMDADLGVLVANQKAFLPSNFESTDFGEVLSQEGLTPGFGLAMEILRNTFFNILSKADTPDQLADMLGDATSSFGTYVEGLARSVPRAAFVVDMFKADHAGEYKKKRKDEDTRSSVSAGGEGTRATGDDEGDGTQAPAGGDTRAPAQAHAQSAAEEGEGQGTAQVESGDPEGGDPASAAPSPEDLAKAAAEAAVSAVTPILETIRAGLADVTKNIEAMGTRLDTVESVSKSATEAVRGLVGGSATGDDGGTSRSNGALKTGASPPMIDTAYSRKGIDD